MLELDGCFRFCEEMLCPSWQCIFSAFCAVLCCGGMSQPDTREDFAKCFDAQCFGDILCEKKHNLFDLLMLILSPAVPCVQ